MRLRRCAAVLFILAAVLSSSWVGIASAQAPPRPASSSAKPSGNLLQVMRSILFTNSNIIFAAQGHDPAALKADDSPTDSTNAPTGMFGGWEAVENSGIALAEAANLLSIPGRVCSNGKPVPVQNADWIKFVQGLRDAGMATYKAAQTKKQDAIVDVSGQVSDACSNCHDVYREKTPAQGGVAARCTK
jgi:hypothetical protein